MNNIWKHLDYLGAFFICLVLLVLVACGIDGEVKFMLAAATGWLFKGGYDLRKATVIAKSHNKGKPP